MVFEGLPFGEKKSLQKIADTSFNQVAFYDFHNFSQGKVVVKMF